MNKEQAIKTAEFRVIYPTDVRPNLEVLPLEEVKNIISQIHEPQKVVVPKFVAEWIESYRYGHTLLKVLNASEKEQIVPSTVNDWILDNQYDFIKAWLDGYEVEKEQLYTVEFPTGQQLYKNYPNGGSAKQIVIKFANHADKDGHFTKMELESTGFEWVFDCKGVKVKEVE